MARVRQVKEAAEFSICMQRLHFLVIPTKYISISSQAILEIAVYSFRYNHANDESLGRFNVTFLQLLNKTATKFMASSRHFALDNQRAFCSCTSLDTRKKSKLSLSLQNSTLYRIFRRSSALFALGNECAPIEAANLRL